MGAALHCLACRIKPRPLQPSICAEQSSNPPPETLGLHGRGRDTGDQRRSVPRLLDDPIMCDPATLAVSAAVMSTISAGVGAVGAASQARYQAHIADRNADMASEAAAQEQENTRQSAPHHYRQVDQDRKSVV